MLQPEGRIGRYEIERRVAQGGMATLYLARDPVLGRPVALKLFFEDIEQSEGHERFVREARAAAALNHPNIVTIYDYGEYVSQPYIVMEFIEGETVGAAIRRRATIPTTTRLRWMEELCAAVSYAHSNGVIHRDLKPPNLIIDSYGRLKVLDFGIARMRGTLASRATARVGTAGYMAPEQVLGGHIDHRSDLFSIGVVCYELMAFVEPFGAETDPAITNRILQDEPDPLPTVVPGIDPEIADLVWKSLRKEPDQRFQDAETMRQAFLDVRRRLELVEPESEGRYVPVRPAVPETPGKTTDPARQGRLHEPDVALRPTPVPGKHADRQALVKQRTAQIQESLLLARQHFEVGNLESARAQCEVVLLLDRAHPEAQALLEQINQQLNSATVVLPPSRPPTGPIRPPTGAIRPPTGPVRPPTGPVAPSRSTSPDIGSEAMTQISTGGSYVPPMPRVDPAHPGQSRPAAPSPVASSPVPSVARPSTSRGLSSRQWIAIVAGLAIVVALGVAIKFWMGRQAKPPVVPAAVDFLIDATPWATITEIKDDATGVAEQLSGDTSTPFALKLKPGAYTITFAGPAQESKNEKVQVAAGSNSPFVIHFEQMTPDQYFQQYREPALPSGQPQGAIK